MEYTFVKDYKHNLLLRNSFNQLAEAIFGLNFERWYELGCWNEHYIPYSFVHQNQIISNVSVNQMSLVINGKKKQAIQIGTVMTHPDFRHQGFIKKLLEIIFKEFNRTDLFYLFANESVLHFYPKFGFNPIYEAQYQLKIVDTNTPTKLRKLNINDPDDFKHIKRLTTNRHPISNKFSSIEDKHLLMFYVLYEFSENLYYDESLDIIVIYQNINDDIHLFDIISSKPFSLSEILKKISAQSNQVIFYFTPDDLTTKKMSKVIVNNHLFVKSKQLDFDFFNDFTVPYTSKA